MSINGNGLGFSLLATVSPMSILSIPAIVTISPANATSISTFLSPSYP